MDSSPCLLSLKDFLSNDLMIHIIGAAISGYLIPYFTRIWQELKLKVELVETIYKSITAIVMAVDSAQKDNQIQNRNLENEQVNLHINCSLIGSQINAYFYDKLNKPIKEFWENYYRLIDKFSEIHKSKDKNKTKEEIKDCIQYINKIVGKNYKKYDQKKETICYACSKEIEDY